MSATLGTMALYPAESVKGQEAHLALPKMPWATQMILQVVCFFMVSYFQKLDSHLCLPAGLRHPSYQLAGAGFGPDGGSQLDLWLGHDSVSSH